MISVIIVGIIVGAIGELISRRFTIINWQTMISISCIGTWVGGYLFPSLGIIVDSVSVMSVVIGALLCTVIVVGINRTLMVIEEE